MVQLQGSLHDNKIFQNDNLIKGQRIEELVSNNNLPNYQVLKSYKEEFENEQMFNKFEIYNDQIFTAKSLLGQQCRVIDKNLEQGYKKIIFQKLIKMSTKLKVLSKRQLSLMMIFLYVDQKMVGFSY
ncbi:UNKNOWN [Stylonychia lemnae]|uniref:Uncharacterized protein n=1 Tax=Stylonychia lemnae TaxID=5949 RepID=A0A078A730_STYLE|nr:UNKNOWN [Stylonychia lemnae]|eukprot:CDW78060.1 UNKNOWN [Stylonychia lemnae]